MDLINNINQACADLANIKTAIQDAGVAIEPGTPSSEYAGKIGELYEAGKQAEYDKFWDMYQQNGDRVNYACAFGGVCWNSDTFKPKYDMCPTDSYMMFRGCAITDLRNLPVKLDFSNTRNAQYLFQWATTQYIGVIDVRDTTQTNNIFSYATELKSIDLLKVSENNKFDNWFTSCSKLKSITFTEDSVIANNISFQPCPLNRASFESVFAALSSSVTGMTATFKKSAKEAAFTSEEWSELIATKPNWTISLV